MTTRFLIAAALMASACVAHADVLPATTPANGAGSDVLMQALYSKVSAAVGNDSKVSLKQGEDGSVYVQGLSAAKAAALAGDDMSVINTSMGFKVVAAANLTGTTTTPTTTAPGTTNGSSGSSGSNGSGSGSGSGSDSGSGSGSGSGSNSGSGSDTGLGAGGNVNVGAGDLGSQPADAANVPEPSSVFLMLAGMLGVVGLRRRAR
jgi:hypothetical protein